MLKTGILILFLALLFPLLGLEIGFYVFDTNTSEVTAFRIRVTQNAPLYRTASTWLTEFRKWRKCKPCVTSESARSSSCNCREMQNHISDRVIQDPAAQKISEARVVTARKRKVFPQLNPTVCVCVLSYQRLHLLNKTLSSIVEHMESDERDVTYEIVWVDNGSPERDVVDIMSRFSIEKRVLLGDNYGIAYGINTLFFRMCTAPYILTLEEDWVWNPSVPPEPLDVVPWQRRSLSAAISILKADESVAGVLLRNETFDQFLSPSDWQLVWLDNENVPVRYRRYCMNYKASYVWGAYTNGAALYDRRRLQRVGWLYGEKGNSVRFPHAVTEGNYAVRVGLLYCSAMLQTRLDCENSFCNGVFEHTGVHSKAAPELKPFVKSQERVQWLFYDTPFYSKMEKALKEAGAKLVEVGNGTAYFD